MTTVNKYEVHYTLDGVKQEPHFVETDHPNHANNLTAREFENDPRKFQVTEIKIVSEIDD